MNENIDKIKENSQCIMINLIMLLWHFYTMIHTINFKAIQSQ